MSPVKLFLHSNTDFMSADEYDASPYVAEICRRIT